MKKFDALIIGTGMGGLVCGNVLVKEGYRVCMVEKNKQLGGCLQVYVRDKVIFDSGVHYLGGLDKGQNLYQIFKWLGIMEKISLERMDPAFDRILIGSGHKEYRIMQGYEAFEKELIREFPDEADAVRKYIQTIRETCDQFPLYRLQLEGDAGKKVETMKSSAKQFIEAITKNEKLRAVLAGNNMLYAGSGEATPLFVHALTVDSYLESAWRVMEGGSQITKVLAQNIREAGGFIIKNREVKTLITDEKEITSALLSDGTEIQAGNYISNTTPANTYRMTDSKLIRPATRMRAEELQHTVSSFILNIVFKKNHFPYFRHNYYYQSPDSVWEMDAYDEKNWPMGYAIYLTPGALNEYAKGMTIFTYMRYEEVLPWAASFNTISSKQNRGTSYEVFKNEKKEQLLNRVEERFPDVRKSILHCYTATPLSFRDYIGSDDGNLYGSAKDYRNPLGTLISPKTRIPNLFLTGQYLNLHGILGTSISGLITAMAVTNKSDFIEKIRNA